MEYIPKSLSEADAAHDMALRVAEGARPAGLDGGTPSSAALRSTGSRLGQTELAGLSGQWTLAHGILAGDAALESRWSQLSGSIDLTRWLEPPRSVILSEKPRMAGVASIAVPEMCHWLIARALPRLMPAKVNDRKSNEILVGSSERTNSVSGFGARDGDLILAILRARISSVTKMPGVGTDQHPALLCGIGIPATFRHRPRSELARLRNKIRRERPARAYFLAFAQQR
jgi:hypothetical protein